MRLLILGGTAEASALAQRIARRGDLDALLSLAGRTQNPAPAPIPCRVGGFGGIEGLKAFLTGGAFDAVIDATHPFAAQMSRHAETACRELGMPLAAFTRPPWQERDGDRWVRVADMESALRALGEAPRRVFLTIGGLRVAAFANAPRHYYLVRTIEAPASFSMPLSGRLILARGPFGVDDEIALMRAERIDTLVSKNSGGAATEAKIAAARMLGIAVVMVERPPAPDIRTFHTIGEILAWIEGHRPIP